MPVAGRGKLTTGEVVKMGNWKNTLRGLASGTSRDKAVNEAANGDPQRATAFAIIYLADTLREITADDPN